MAQQKLWTPPAIHTSYHELRMTLEARAAAANIDPHQVKVVHTRWKTLGKLAANGRLK